MKIMNKLLENIDKLHTTTMGIDRIKNNLKINGNVLEYCKEKIKDERSKKIIKGKNCIVK